MISTFSFLRRRLAKHILIQMRFAHFNTDCVSLENVFTFFPTSFFVLSPFSLRHLRVLVQQGHLGEDEGGLGVDQLHCLLVPGQPAPLDRRKSHPCVETRQVDRGNLVSSPLPHGVRGPGNLTLLQWRGCCCARCCCVLLGCECVYFCWV